MIPPRSAAAPAAVLDAALRGRRSAQRRHLALLASVLLLASTQLLPSRGQTDEEPKAPAPPRCQVAIVNPVSGNAECVEPRGAPVDPAPPRPPPSDDACRRHSELGVAACQPPPAAPQG